MTATCVRCTRPMPDSAYVCQADAQALAGALLTAAGHAEDAETVIARQARYGAGGRGGSDEPMPVDLTASARYAAIENTINTWAGHVLEQTGQWVPAWHRMAGPLCPPTGTRCPHGSCDAIRRVWAYSMLGSDATWLAGQVDWLRKRPEADEAFAELHDACEQLARLVDRPADKELVGMCDCGKVLYAPPGRAQVKCPEKTCELRWNVDESRRILREALDGKLVTVSESARLIAYLDDKRTQDTIRKLVTSRINSGQIAAHGEIDDQPTYRFGEVVSVLASIPLRTRRATA